MRPFSKQDEVFLVEGSSAASSVRQVCNRQTQSVFAVQGKVPNANRKSRAVIGRNAQVQRLMQYLSLDDTIDSRFGKIIILCDPDIDGQHASYLLASLLRAVRPVWVESKIVFVAVAPLISHSVATCVDGSGDLGAHNASRGIVRYHKGIASMDADLLSQTCIDKSTRRLTLLKLCDAAG